MSDQRAHDEQPPPEHDTVGPTENQDEKEDCGPPSVKLRSGISKIEPSRPSEPHKQESTSNDSPDGGLVPEAEKVAVQKDQPNLSEILNVMQRVLDVLQDSSIASKSGKDHRSRFWGVYKRVAEEHDGEFLERYTSDMDIVLVFSGLFSAVSTSFIVAMEYNLSPNPSDTTNALLTQLVQIGLGNLTAAGSAAAAPASTWSPPTPTIWIQMIAYASLSMSLLAAFGAVLGKQWLGYYKSNRYGRGSQEERGKRRQEKFDGLVAWYFDAVVQSFPVLLQISLLLFGIAISANMWYEQRSIACVIIATTVFGFLFYSLTVMACLISPSCPFQTPISSILRMLCIDRVLLLIFKPASRRFQQLMTSAHGVLSRLIGALRSKWTRLSEALRGPVRVVGAFTRQYLQQSFITLHNGLHFFVLHSSTKVVDSEAQSLDQNLDVLAENARVFQVALSLPDIPTCDLDAPSIKWLLETSTDPEVFLIAAKLVPHVEWPLDLDVSDMLHHLYDIFTSCVDSQSQRVPSSLEEKASACILALSHLYCGRILHAYPGRGEFLGCGERDTFLFDEMRWSTTPEVDYAVIVMTMNLSLMDHEHHTLTSLPNRLKDYPNSFPEWLSHVLPYHFVTRRADEGVEELAISVISQLLCSPSSPSPQIIANCTFLACVMVGIQVDKKDIVRIDKSSALPHLAESLMTQFEKVLWACDGGDNDKDKTGNARRAWFLLDVICHIFKRAKYTEASPHMMRNLDVCRKVYSRLRSSEQTDYSYVSWAALRKVLHFTFAAAGVSWDPAKLWSADRVQFGQDDSHSDWLVDYLDYIYIDSGDHETIYDILLLLGSTRMRYSPAKQHVFVERLVACMDSNMPGHLRHAALRAAYSARDDMTSIQVMDDATRDIVLTKLSPAILSVVCPLPGATPANDDPRRSFDSSRDLCYLKLVFVLARNSFWHPHLYGDHHIDLCISLIAEYCKSPTKHAFYMAAILTQIPPAQMAVTPPASVTQQQGWEVMSNVWSNHYYTLHDHYLESLPVLAECTKWYMQIASKSDLEWFIRRVDKVLRGLERRLEIFGLAYATQGGEAAIAAAMDLRTVAIDMLERFGQ